MSIFVPIDATRAREIIAEQNRIREKEMSIIDPTDAEPRHWGIANHLEPFQPVEPTFWEKAKEMVLEKLKDSKSPNAIFERTERTMAILKAIDTLPNSELLDDEKRFWLVSGVMDKGVDLSKDVKIQDDGTIHILVDTSDDFSPETLAALSCNPWHLMPPASSFYSHYGTAQNAMTILLKERLQAYLRTKEPKKKKADYKAKFYKNTAKQSKPSPMLMSLIGKTK